MQARKRAAIRQLIARLTGENGNLLSYNDVVETLATGDLVQQGIQEIELDAIVGSVGRFNDFTREFLPKNDSDGERWARVKASLADMKGWDPIDVYQLGTLYFVKDGNHRVSVARQLGSQTISARVTEVPTHVPLVDDSDPETVIEEAQLANFLLLTQFDKLFPKVNIRLSFYTQYKVLLDGIATRAKQLGTPEQYSAEAVRDWYEQDFLPIVRLMRHYGTLSAFESRTEADLYVLLVRHCDELAEALGWHVDPQLAVSDMAASQASIWQRVGERVKQVIVPPELAAGPTPGQWRLERAQRRNGRLFADILVNVQNDDHDWALLEDTIVLANAKERSRVFGVHVVDSEAELSAESTQSVKTRFLNRCDEAGLEAEFSVEIGRVGAVMLRRARWVDLVVTNMTAPSYFDGSILQQGTGIERLIQQCPCPLLTLPPGAQSPMDRILLAYDGSAKSNEALYVAAYVAARHNQDLVVLTVETDHTSAEMLEKARQYLSKNPAIKARYVLRQKPIAKAILDVSAEFDRNHLIIGGFGFSPMRYLLLGSTVNELLNSFHNPILVCR